QAALDGLRARQHLVRPLREVEKPAALRTEMRSALLDMARAASATDPRLRDRKRDLALLEGLPFDLERFGQDLTPAVLKAIHAAALAVAGDEEESALVATETVIAARWPQSEEQEDYRSIGRWLRAHRDAAAPYGLARALVVANVSAWDALARGGDAD